MQSESRPEAPLPEHFHVEEDGERTTLSWRWFRWYYVIQAVMCLLWAGASIPRFLNPPMSTQEQPLSSPLITLLFVAVPVLVSYWTLAGLLNTTRIEVSRDELRIQHGPLPWPGNRTVSSHELTQLYGQEVRGNKGAVSYSLFALDTQGRKVKLVSGLDDKDQALYLEQTLEHRLGIEDSPVDGELAQRDQVA